LRHDCPRRSGFCPAYAAARIVADDHRDRVRQSVRRIPQPAGLAPDHGARIRPRRPKQFPTVLAYATDPIGPFSAGGTLLLDPITGGGTTKVLEFDSGGGSGGGGGASDAGAVTYHSVTYPTVQAALDALLYVAPKINSFTNTGGSVEKGASVASVTLNWSFNKTMTSVTINGVAVDPTLASQTITGPFTTNQSWTMVAGDGVNSTTSTTSLNFLGKRYWGASALTSLDNAAVLGLGASELASNFNKSITYNCAGGKYPYFAYPASFGSPASVICNGLSFSDFSVTTLSVTNASGFTQTYNILRFNGIQTGAAIPVTWQ
jgi:hypothetical protein